MKFIAVDLGASSGRVMLANMNDGKMELEEIHRFPNSGIQTPDGFLWEYHKLFDEILRGFSRVVQKYGSKIDGIGIDTWGVDFVLLDEEKKPLSHFYHYRDERTVGTYEKIFKRISKEEIYQITGIQFMRINTICQIFESMQSLRDSKEKVCHFLMVPDYFTFLLTGKIINEYTDASTTQFLDAQKRTWSKKILNALDIPKSIFHELSYPGTKIGNILASIAEKTGLDPETPIFAVATHDTGSAVAAVPYDIEKYQSGEWAFLSSGTWSIIGAEMPEPILTEKVANENYSNEGGINGTIRLLKNSTGFWILEECMKIWKQENPNFSWDNLIIETKTSNLLDQFIDVNHEDFVSPSQMLETINTHYSKKYGSKLAAIGDVGCVIFSSMVETYKNLIGSIEEIIGNSIKILHVIGGGSRNSYLNQLIANKLNIPVLAGPAEATTIGNVLMQMIGSGIVKNLTEGRKIIRDSFDVKVFNPKY